VYICARRKAGRGARSTATLCFTLEPLFLLLLALLGLALVVPAFLLASRFVRILKHSPQPPVRRGARAGTSTDFPPLAPCAASSRLLPLTRPSRPRAALAPARRHTLTMSNPAHKYAPFNPNHADGSDGDSAGSIVMRTSINKAALKDMERAVFAGKKAIWPLFFATLVVGVSTSVWGLLKEKGDRASSSLSFSSPNS